MRMDIKYKDGNAIFLHYEQFKVASAKDKYKLTVGGFQGTGSNPMAQHNGMYFTTKDRDNDQWPNNCAIDLLGHARPAGGWWYSQCWAINPNDYYNDLRSLVRESQLVEIKIRPVNCNI